MNIFKRMSRTLAEDYHSRNIAPFVVRGRYFLSGCRGCYAPDFARVVALSNPLGVQRIAGHVHPANSVEFSVWRQMFEKHKRRIGMRRDETHSGAPYDPHIFVLRALSTICLRVCST